jgi:hypothetical protein
MTDTYGDTDLGAPEPPSSSASISPPAAPELPTIRKPSNSDTCRARASRVRELFQRARSHRQQLMDQWVQNYELVHNRAWSPHRSSHLPSPSPAEMWPIVNAIVAWESDSSPAFDVIPAASPNSETYTSQYRIAQDLRTSLRAAQHNCGYDEQIQRFLWDGNVYGTGILKTLWDQSTHMGLGDAVVRRIDPFQFYPDPDATSIDDAQFLIEAQEVNDDTLEVRYPGALACVRDTGSFGEADRSPTLAEEGRGRAPKSNPGPMDGVANEGYGLPGQGRSSKVDRPIDSERHLILECWWRRVTPEGQRWWVTVICGNCVLLEVPATDLWGHGDQPYERWVPTDTGEFWGASLVTLLAPLQRSLNRMLAAMEHNIDLAGNPIMLEDVGSGITRTRVTNKPGTRLSKNSGREVRWLDPPRMQPNEVMQLIQFYVGEMERISGLSAIVRGATPTGRNSEGVIGSMQEAAFVRIRMALRNLEFTLRRLGNKTAALIAEFYDTERVVSFLGPSGERMVADLKGKHFYVPDRNSESPSPIRFALHVQAGSTLPTSRQARSADADTLFAMGAIDEEAVLQAHEFPNWPDVVARVREQKAAMAAQGEDPSQFGPGARAAAGRTS